MRIAIFTEVFLPKIDGVVTRIIRTVDQLAEMGHDVVIFATGDAPDTYAGFPVETVPSISFHWIYPEIKVGLPMPRISKRLKEFDPDIVHIVNPVAYAGYAAVVARRQKIPLLASFHTDVPAYTKDPKPRGPEHFSYLGIVRKVGMLPAFAASIGVLGYDLVASIPDLLTPLPEGPRVGVGVSVALLLFGAVMGSERRGFEGYVPDAAAKARAGRWILVLRVLLLVSFALSLVMVVGKAVNGDPAFALVTLSNSLGSLALGLFIANPKLNEQPSWYVFLVGATAAMVVGAAADNSLRLEYAAPGSFSTSYVWLPFAFAAFGLLLSRSYVRSSTHNFKRVDWLMYAARTFEFSRTMHGVAFAAVLVYFAAILVGYDARGGSGLAILQLLLVALLALLSHFGRKALVRKNAVKARGHAVSIGAALTLLGFLGVIVFSVVTGAAAGLTNGGLGLVAGITAALMITVPAPVRDEHGVPDLERTFAEFRARINGAAGATAFLPDVSEARRRTHRFPSSVSPEALSPATPDPDPAKES